MLWIYARIHFKLFSQSARKEIYFHIFDSKLQTGKISSASAWANERSAVNSSDSENL
jgi:hypothetical protein